MIRIITLLCFLCLSTNVLISQTRIIEGYVFETGNRGYINYAKVDLQSASGELIESEFSNNEGYFSFEVENSKDYIISISKELYDTQELNVNKVDYELGEKVFVKIRLKRSPGYQFEITLAPKRDDENIPVDAINGSTIEVYNNTTKEEVLVLEEHPSPHFTVNLFKGNHYTVLVRKDDFMAKRMEAFVDVEGCILCFEGIGSITPGVADNLTGGNEMGVLLANVELEKIFTGKKIEIQNIYYDYGSSKLRDDGKEELDKLVTLIKDNPTINVELGSHTDSRGKKAQNQKLSIARAKAAVGYLVDKGGVPEKNIIARGYGESEIKNGCIDGVECNETKHQENRRTELKITGISSKKPEFISLEKMKKNEQMELMILELQDQEQIKVGVDQTLEDVINETEVSSNVGEKSEPILDNEVVEIEEVKESFELNKSTKEEASPETEKTGLSSNTNPSKNPNAYIDGPKIIIHESDTFLKPSHDIFKNHQQVFQFLHEDKILYMIGDFKEITKAFEFLSSVKLMYPDSYILNFEKGVIVN